MEFDRYHVKNLAKTILHDARPRPWLITLAYHILAFVLPILLLFLVPLSVLISSIAVSPFYGAQYEAPPTLSLIFFLAFLLLYMLILLLQAGYFSYCLQLWRGEQGRFRDLFRGFSSFPRFFALIGLILLFSLLWLLPALAVMTAVILILQRVQSPELSGLLVLLLQAGLTAYLLNRTLRYALALPLLLDHSDYTPRQALNESKTLMAGRRWKLCLLYLSFVGWQLVAFLVFYFSVFIAWLPVAAVSSSRFSAIASSPESIFFPLWLLLLVTLSLAALLSAPLRLWLSGYMGISFAGFYDCAVGRPPIPPVPSRQPQGPAPEPPAPSDPGSFPEDI